MTLVNGGSPSPSRRGRGAQGGAHLRVGQLAEVGCDVEEDALLGPGQRNPTEEKDDQHDVRVGGGEVNHLAEKLATRSSHPLQRAQSFPAPTSPLSGSAVAFQVNPLQEAFLDS